MPAASGASGPTTVKNDGFFLSELDELGDGGDRHVEQAIFLGRPRVARRHVHARDALGLRQPPGDRMLPAAASYDE